MKLLPVQKVAEPVTETVGRVLTVTLAVVVLVQPVAVEVAVTV